MGRELFPALPVGVHIYDEMVCLAVSGDAGWRLRHEPVQPFLGRPSPDHSATGGIRASDRGTTANRYGFLFLNLAGALSWERHSF